jgi:hypothetical protein
MEEQRHAESTKDHSGNYDAALHIFDFHLVRVLPLEGGEPKHALRRPF